MFKSLISIFISNVQEVYIYTISIVAKTRAKQLAKVLGAEVINKMLNQSVIWPMKIPKQKNLWFLVIVYFCSIFFFLFKNSLKLIFYAKAIN